MGIVAPAGTPAAAIDRLHQEVTAILDCPRRRARFEPEGAEATHEPADMTAFVATETEKWTRVVKEAGIKAE